MNPSISHKSAYTEADIQEAISSIRKKEIPSIRKAALAFNVLYPTLRGRMSERTLRVNAHESEQLLSTPEEKTLVR